MKSKNFGLKIYTIEMILEKIKVETTKQVIFRKFANFDNTLTKIIYEALIIDQIKTKNHTPQNYDIALMLCDKKYMQDLNLKFRDKNKPTNVLSFQDGDDIDGSIHIGDIAICVPVILDEAREQDKTFKKHFLHMFTHGVLHLLGYDHTNSAEMAIMEAAEDLILSKI